MNPPSPAADVSALLARLVACPSVNPGDRCPIEPPYGEGPLAALLADLLRGWGAEVRVWEIAPGRPNLVATFRGADPARSLMFEAHTDTVQVSDMTIAPFTPEVRDGRLFGRGATDTKGSMAAMLLGIRRVLDEDGRMPVTVHVASACDEELGARGARQLIGNGFRPDVAVVGEPTDLAICHAHKGTMRWCIRTRGVAVHSSAPDRGVNAIYHMARVIRLIESEVVPMLHTRRHPLLGEATISVGTIQGGTQPNVVPAACTIEVDRRLLPNEDREAVTADLRARLERLKAEEPRLQVDVEATQYYEPLDVALDSAPCRLAAVACTRALGEARFVTAPWASNAGVFAAVGIPCVLFGPGSIRQAHTKDEFIELAEVARAVDVYAAMIRAAGALDGWPTAP